MMKKLALWVLLVAGALPVLQSCKVEKRVHRPGYHVEWKKSNSTKVQKSNRQQQEIQTENAQKTPDTKSTKKYVAEDLTAAHHVNVEKRGNAQVFSLAETIAEYQTGLQHTMAEYFDDECDTLFMRDGRVILAIVIEINPAQIKYRRCDYLKGPLITIYKRDVARLVYPNGVEEEFEDKSYYRPEIEHKPEVIERKEPVVESVSIASVFSGVIGLFLTTLPIVGVSVPGLVLGGLAILTGIIGISVVSINPDLYVSKGTAAAGLLLGLLNITLALLVFTN